MQIKKDLRLRTSVFADEHALRKLLLQVSGHAIGTR